jgi:hypothetical protein
MLLKYIKTPELSVPLTFFSRQRKSDASIEIGPALAAKLR